MEVEEVQRVTIDQVVHLRRRVLRQDDLTAEVVVADDWVDGCFHLALASTDEVVACVSAFPSRCPDLHDRLAWQFRFMAVDEPYQGRGLGRRLLEGLLDELRALGVEVAWANARDTAQGFYESLGFTVVEGSAHLSASTALAHHRINLVLSNQTEQA